MDQEVYKEVPNLWDTSCYSERLYVIASLL